MNKIKLLRRFFPAALILSAVFCVIGFCGCDFIFSSQDEEGDYRFHLTEYAVLYDVGADRTVKVTERLTVHYDGFDSTGILRDIPVNGGEKVRNVSVTMANSSPVYYKMVSDSYSFATVSIGDYKNKRGQEESYVLKYDYVLTKAQEGENFLSLNPVGTGWDCLILNASAKILLPEGYKGAVCYAGSVGTNDEYPFSVSEENGRTALFAEISSLLNYSGITFDIEFEEGALSLPAFELSAIIYTVAAAVLAAVIILCKFVFFNKSVLAPIVNLEAPEGMDPLLMGKLIDNKVNGEDISALLFYWADKNYIAIDLTEPDDPTLIQIADSLPEGAADYEKLMFDNIFSSGRTVKSSRLSQKFYVTAQRVTGMVNGKASNLYSKSSMAVSFLFTMLAGILLAAAPFIYGLTAISNRFFYLWGLISLVPAIAIYALGEHLAFNTHKYGAKKKALFSLAVIGAVIAGSAFYTLIIPNYILPFAAKIPLALVSFAACALSSIIISRTKEYTEKLNEIVGFRNFIKLAEKNELERMIEENPQYYYRVLPFAQVLGVSDVWENKFKDIAVPPPQWCSTTGIMEFYLINRLIRTSTAKLSTSIVSRPAPSGSSGFGGFGGGFGGGVGGGHGGGGGRGR